ncbi:MAG: 50S ribosomal protein L25 [Nitrospiraceae bacterium]|nr:MAG: 50S ribosomal protein L25 [Nitrospiraceae bacterium]
MERMSLAAEKREGRGKGVARNLRRQDMVPGVLYREGKAQSIKLSKSVITKIINTMSGEQVIVDLEFADGDKKIALLKDYQIDPVRGELLHTDFFEVSLTEAVRVSVRITPTGEAIGVKRDNGILQHNLREVEIECLPDKIPDRIEVDISHLEIGQSIHVSDLKFGEGIKLISDTEELVLAIIPPVVEEVAAPAEEVVGIEAPEEAAEPEVIKKGKKEDETEGEEKQEKKEK